MVLIKTVAKIPVKAVTTCMREVSGMTFFQAGVTMCGGGSGGGGEGVNTQYMYTFYKKVIDIHIKKTSVLCR